MFYKYNYINIITYTYTYKTGRHQKSLKFTTISTTNIG